MNNELKISFPPGPLREAFAHLCAVHVETTRHRELSAALGRLFMASQTSRENKGLMVSGPSGSGKTTTVRKAEQALRRALGLAPGAPSPLPMALLTSNTTPKALVSNVMHAAGDPLAMRGSQSDIELRMKEVGRDLPVCGIAIDEFHHAFTRKSPAESERMAMTLKTVVNSLQMPIIVMGIDGIDAFIEDSPELSQRFSRRVYLTDPLVESPEDLEDIRQLMRAMKEVLPCEPSLDLESPDFLPGLLLAAECRFGRVVDLVRRACEFGAAEQAKRVSLTHLRQAYRESARRDRRSDAHNPFLMPVPTAQTLIQQMQSKPQQSARRQQD